MVSFFPQIYVEIYVCIYIYYNYIIYIYDIISHNYILVYTKFAYDFIIPDTPGRS